MNKQNDTPATTTLIFETSHEARTQAADHLETIVREAGMTRTDAYRDNAKGTDHARYTLEVPADQACDTARAITTDLTANGIRTSWYDATEPGPDPNQTYQPGDLVTNNDDTYEVEKVVHRKANGWEIYQIRNTRTGERHTVHEDTLEPAPQDQEPDPQPATPETPEAAAARFWREGSEAQGGGTPEFEAKDVEEWLTPITDPDRREATKEAIYDRAEPMNLPTLTPRFTEDELRDILSDTRTDLEDALQQEEEAQIEAHEARNEAKFWRKAHNDLQARIQAARILF